MSARAALAAAVAFTLAAPAGAMPGTPAPALGEAAAAFAKIDDYTSTVVVHETAGGHTEDRTYIVRFKKPALERIDIAAGPGKGSGVVWLGGDQVKGHRGGLLSGLHLTFDLHDKQVTSLRGDTVSSTTIPAMLDDFTTIKGTVSQAAGPQIAAGDSVAVTLDVADPANDDGVSREVLYLSTATDLPVRRERFAGSDLVKSENFTDMKFNVGLTTGDFPW